MKREIKYRVWDPKHNKIFGVKSIFFKEDGIGISQINYVIENMTEFNRYKPA